MITLITGIPGMGKTSLLVTMLLEEEKKAQRPIFVMGIPDLAIEHNPAPPVSEWCEKRPDPNDPSLELDYYCFPPNSILVVDECQRVFRARSTGTKVPPEVAAMETHRHTGLDIILLTQKPKLIDINVRELVGRHIHIRAGLLGRHLYEWPHIADGESRTDRSEAAKRRYKPPRSAFNKYKSAEVHTKQKFRVNQLIVYAVVAVVFAAVMLFKAGSRIYEGFSPMMHSNDPKKPVVLEAKKEPQNPERSTRAGGSGSAPISPSSRTIQAGVVQLADPVAQFVPMDGQHEHTAPAYAGILQVSAVPLPAACIASKSKCKCYTDQGTPLDLMPEDECRHRAEHSVFDPYKSPAGGRGFVPPVAKFQPPPVNEPAGAI